MRRINKEKMMSGKGRHMAGLILALAFLLLAGAALAGSKPVQPGNSQGQEIYVPAYTKVFYGLKGQSFPLVTTLLFHNTDPQNPLKITSVRYYNHEGRLVGECVEEPINLTPLGAWEYLVKKPVETGGSGACFVVSWRAHTKISPPIVESVMISSSGQQGISFASFGKVIRELGD